MRDRPTKTSFRKDVAKHEMQVLLDQGMHRHLQFKAPDSYNNYFNIVTWPGYLCIGGDMGCYVFTRLADMFDFFRVDRQHQKDINPSYWGEKCESTDKKGITEYSEKKAEKVIKESLADWLKWSSLTPAQKREVREAVQNEVLIYVDGDEFELRQQLRDFTHEHCGNLFDDSWEWDLRTYTYHYLWCCYAIAFAIKQYDKFKEKAQCPTTPPP